MQRPEIDSLDKRSLAYQFDLERDIPWGAMSEPGLYFSLTLLGKLGFNTELLARTPEAMDVCQWVMALAMAEAFVHLERDVIRFIEQGCGVIVPSRSSALLADEERKHIELFQRFSTKLRKERPDLVASFDAVFCPPDAFAMLENQFDRCTGTEIQWLCWLTTLFFEEYTLYICRCLEEEEGAIQPAWLAAHRCHRREEAQHILTDAAYLEGLPISADKRRHLATVFTYSVESNVSAFFSVATWLRFQEQLFPGKDFLPRGIVLRQMPVFQDLRQHPVFRYTRHFLPAMVRNPGAGRSPGMAVISVRKRSQHAGKLSQGDTLFERFERIVGGNADIVFTTAQRGRSRISYERLFERSEKVLSALQAVGLRRKDPVVIWLNEPKKMLPVFWGCVLGGFAPIVLTPTVFVDRNEEEINRLLRVLKRSNSTVVVADDAVTGPLSMVLRDKEARTVRVMGALELEETGLGTASLYRPCASDLAMVQFSSGSMGDPRGAALTHRNLTAVIDAMLNARGGKADDVFVNWLPLSHDMGLIGFHLTPLAIGATQVHMPTQEVVKRPLFWLRSLHQFKAGVTGGTSSALKRVLSKVKPDFIEQLDLSGLHSLIVGAEPVAGAVLEELIQVCAPAGLQRRAVCPAYGLAEASLAVTMMPECEELRVERFSRRRLGQGEATLTSDINDAVELVNLGVPVKGTQMRIVDDAGHVVQENMIGQVEVSGSSVMSGYFRDEIATGKVKNDGWLNTGDRGFVRDGRFYFVGREREAFFIHGRNYFARDVENIAAEIDQVAAGEVALIVDHADTVDSSRLILFVAMRAQSDKTVREVLASVYAHVKRRLGISLDEVVGVARKDISRTTSGKIARDHLLRRYRSGSIGRERVTREAGSPSLGAVKATEPRSERLSSLEGQTKFWKDVVGNVRTIWAEVLVRPVGEIRDDDDFRALGGDSLNAAEVLVRLENASGLFYPADLLAYGTTVRKMAAFVQKRADRHGSVPMRSLSEHVNETVSMCGNSNVAGRTGGSTASMRSPERHMVGCEDRSGALSDVAAMLPNGTSRASVLSGSIQTSQVASPTLIPIAVIGMGVRLPSARTTAEFWRLLVEGRHAFQPIPGVRRHGPIWNEAGRRPVSAYETGAFLDAIEQFDPRPFGIPDEEARFIEPQQRLFLEVCQEALDHAAIVDRRVGVFAAAGENEYGLRYLADIDKVERHSLLGGLRNMVAARVAQVFGFSGPALAVDTACSASATSVHLACESLRSGECSTALAGGVQLNLSNQIYTFFGRAGLLSSAGECRPFDRDASGLVPGEGAGVVLLKPLPQALADGDQVLGVICSSAVSNDGGALSGTAPSSVGQRRVIQDAYERAHISPTSVSYIEAHATGTVVGDAVEIRSLTEALGKLPNKIPVGSVKSNVGHTLAAAGITSLIKVLLMLKYKKIPPTVGCTHPAERIGFEATPLYPSTKSTEWQTHGEIIRRAGINSFGLGGTNVHLIVEEAPELRGEPVEPEERSIFCLSAVPDQTSRVAESYCQYIAESSASLAEICAASLTRGQLLMRRQALVTDSKSALIRALKDLAVKVKESRSERQLVAFVFPGTGSATRDATRYLLAVEPKFREAWEACCSYLRTQGVDLSVNIDQPSRESDSLAISQAQVFSFSVAAARWLSHLGVLPNTVIGHGVGEYAAAHVAGILSLEDALRLVLRRAELMSCSSGGQMLAVFASEPDLQRVLGKAEVRVQIAARNSPRQVVLSGPLADIAHIAEWCAESGISTRTLAIPCAAHLSVMEAAQHEFQADVEGTAFAAPQVPFISAIEGRLISGTDAAYWLKHLRAPIEFASAVRDACAQHVGTFIELNGGADLGDCIAETGSDIDTKLQLIPLVGRTRDGRVEIVESLAAMVNAGIPVHITRSHVSSGVRHAELPPYPFERVRHWIDVAEMPMRGSDNALIGSEEYAIRDHRVDGLPTAPLAWLVDRVLHATYVGDAEAHALYKIVLSRGFSIPEGEIRRLEISKDPGGEHGKWVVRSNDVSTDDWLEHMLCLARPLRGRTFSKIDLESIAARCPVFISPDAIYDWLSWGGLQLGPAMRSLKSVQVGDGELLARLEAPKVATQGRFVDTCLLDGASHAVAAFAYGLAEKRPALYVGFSMESLQVFACVHDAAIAYVQLRSAADSAAEVIRYDIVLAAEDGEVLLVVEDFSARRISPSARSEQAAGSRTGATVAREGLNVDRGKQHGSGQDDRDDDDVGKKEAAPKELSNIDITRSVRRIVALHLGVAPLQIPLQDQFATLGVDSLMAVQIAQALESELGITLHSTLLFEVRTLADLGNLLLDKLRGQRE